MKHLYCANIAVTSAVSVQLSIKYGAGEAVGLPVRNYSRTICSCTVSQKKTLCHLPELQHNVDHLVISKKLTDISLQGICNTYKTAEQCTH